MQLNFEISETLTVPGPARGSPESVDTLIAPIRRHELFRREVLRRGVGRGLVSGLVAGLAIGLVVGSLSGVVAGVAVGAGVGAVVGLVFTFSRPGADETSSMIPLTSWRNDRAVGLVVGLVVGLGAGLVFMLFATKTWPAAVSFVQLAVRWHSPVRLMRFLEDARSRSVLRIVGPVYQFRHARLQDYLAEQARPTVGPLPAATSDAARSAPGDR